MHLDISIVLLLWKVEFHGVELAQLQQERYQLVWQLPWSQKMSIGSHIIKEVLCPKNPEFLNQSISHFYFILLLFFIINKYKFIKFADSNIWSSTLAGDLAQSALLKRKGQTYVGPDGYFNNTLCPTEFMLRISNQGMRYH